MSMLKQIGSPDEVVGFLMEELCVADPSGMSVQELWDVLVAHNGEIDDFTKKLFWSWLIKEEDFIVCDKKGALIDKAKVRSLREVNENQHRLKVTKERQSLHLLGVATASDTVGAYPYELLRVITKQREKGILATDLAEATGQDPRSFTGRLAVLADLDAIKKIPVIVKGVNTSMIINSKYADDPRFGGGNNASQINKMSIALDILSTLKRSPNGVRAPLDLRAELKLDSPKSISRHYASIVNVLEKLGCLSFVSIKEEGRKRQFSALQYIKEFPKNFPTTQFSSLLEQVKDNDSVIGIGSSEESAEEDESIPELNRFFPLQAQLFDATVSAGEKGISSMDLGKKLLGDKNIRNFQKFLAFASSEKIVKGRGAYTIVRGQDIHGKVKFYRYIHQPLFLKSKGMPVEEINDEFKPVNSKDFEFCLAQFSAKHYGGTCTKIQSIPFKNHPSAIWWNGYTGKLMKSELLHVKNVFKIGTLIFDEDKSEIPITASYKKDLSIVKRKPAPPIKDDHTPLAKSEIINVEDPAASFANKAIPEELEVSFSTSKTDRNDFLLEFINKAKIAMVDTAFCYEVKKEMELDTLPDIRTLRKDIADFEARGLVTTKTPQHPYRLHNILLVSSTTNKPTDEDEINIFRNIKKNNNTKSTRDVTRLRTFADVPIVEVNKLHFFAEPTRRLKKPSAEERRLSALENREVDDFVSDKLDLDTLTKEPRKRRTRKVGPKKRPLDETSSADADGNLNGTEVEVKDEYDELNIFIPQKKRKKLTHPKKRHDSSIPSTIKKNRTSLKVDIRDTMLILRSVIVLQSLSPNSNIDWVSVASLFGEYKDITAETLRRQWSRIKKEVGNKVLQQTKTSWEKIVMKSIKNGDLTKEDLIRGDLISMLELWRKLDESSFDGIKSSIFRDIEDNYHGNKFKLDYSPQGLEIFRDLMSVVEREEFFNKTSFTYPVEEDEEDIKEYRDTPNEMDVIKIKLKALFATPASKFNSDKVKSLFMEIGEENSKKAILELENAREIAFLGEDADTKFTLTDKSLSLLETKFNEKMLDNASKMYDALEDLSLNNQGMILSKKTPDGCYFPIVNAISEKSVNITRIDKEQEDLTKNYSTRQTDKSRFEGDFILSGYKKEKIEDKAFAIRSIPLPIGKPCSRLWIDLAGDLNRTIWIKSLLVLLQIVVQRPGVTFKLLVKRLTPLMTPFEIRDLLNWLESKNGIRRMDYDGYCSQPNWYLSLNK